ncbi:MAG: helix-turn-helix domain-containing protein [Actinomycetota bacterium]
MPRTGYTTVDDLLTTGQAAKLLGTSRQHVVDLCTSGRLSYQKVGAHRRVSRRAVEAIQERSLELSPDQERSLWLHRAVAGKLALNPSRVLGQARRNLGRLREVHTRGRVQAQFDAWQTLLDGPLTSLMDFLVSKSPSALELRQNSPFAGVLSQTERCKALEAFHQATRAA